MAGFGVGSLAHERLLRSRYTHDSCDWIEPRARNGCDGDLSSSGVQDGGVFEVRAATNCRVQVMALGKLEAKDMTEPGL